MTTFPLPAFVRNSVEAIDNITHAMLDVNASASQYRSSRNAMRALWFSSYLLPCVPLLLALATASEPNRVLLAMPFVVGMLATLRFFSVSKGNIEPGSVALGIFAALLALTSLITVLTLLVPVLLSGAP